MQSIQSWIRRITDNEMPIFGRTVQEVVSVSENDDSSAAQLGQVVLKDAAMTSRVLKMANSSYYNPSRQRFSTISRAIMMLGFDTVRSMCLTVALIDSLVQGRHREHLVQEMARSLHAATQAQAIARQRKDPNPEELFIGALLFHIGDLAFWCFAGEEGNELDKLSQQSGQAPDKAQRKVLGFTLRELSVGLAREWALSELLQDSLEKPQGKDPRTRNIVLTHQLASAAEQGWDNAEVHRLTGELATLAGIPAEVMARQLHANAKQAVETSTCYGAAAVAKIIPLPSAYQPLDQTAEDTQQPVHLGPDQGLQLQILRELTGLMSGQATFNTVVEMVMEGLHRGVGLDRVLFALLSPDHKELRPKYVLGDPDNHLRQAFSLSMNSSAAAPVRYVFSSKLPLWGHAQSPAEVQQNITDAFRWATGSDTLFMAPVVIRDKPVGMFYADCASSGRPLDQDGFDAFCHFSQQADLVLHHLLSRR